MKEQLFLEFGNYEERKRKIEKERIINIENFTDDYNKKKEIINNLKSKSDIRDCIVIDSFPQ